MIVICFTDRKLKWIPNNTPNVGIHPGTKNGCVRVNVGGIYKTKIHLTYKHPKRCNKNQGYEINVKIEIIENSSQATRLENIVKDYSDAHQFRGHAETLELGRDPLEVNAGDQVCIVVNEEQCIDSSPATNLFDISLQYVNSNDSFSSFDPA